MKHSPQSGLVTTSGTAVYARVTGAGPPVLLLHGFPQTHLMWRDVAPRLADRFTVVCADLRGYGQSGAPPSTEDHEPYSKRAMALDMLEVMACLGFERFAVVGHDRGARVAYRLALDHPDRVTRLGLLDALPILTAWTRADARLALAFWPWSLLAQAEPLPERLLAADPGAVIDNALAEWGTPASTFSPTVRKAYVDAIRDAAHVHAICEEYRAAAGIDRKHDQADADAGRRIRCPVLTLWSANGGLNSWYEGEGGPLALWREWAEDVRGRPMQGGHFFAEEHPHATAEELRRFLS